MNTELFHLLLPSPLGRLKIVASESHLHALLWPNEDPRRVPLPDSAHRPQHSLLQETRRQLQAYFEGRLRRFDLPMHLTGTEFQCAIWKHLREIPYGQTLSYAELASSAGYPRAHRAAGSANGKNPLSILVPCHRVLGADGNLRGFAGGEQAKAWLLNLEKSSS